jgi:hypothetical protein
VLDPVPVKVIPPVHCAFFTALTSLVPRVQAICLYVYFVRPLPHVKATPVCLSVQARSLTMVLDVQKHLPLVSPQQVAAVDFPSHRASCVTTKAGVVPLDTSVDAQCWAVAPLQPVASFQVHRPVQRASLLKSEQTAALYPRVCNAVCVIAVGLRRT